MFFIREERKEDFEAIGLVNGQGIGSRLVRKGLENCRELGHRIVVVIGHPECYPRFVFAPAREKKLDVPFPVPEEALLVCELVPGALEGIEGMVQCPPEFEDMI